MVSDATTPPTVLGWPIYENGSMDGTLTGSAADYTLVSGDVSQYCISRLSYLQDLATHTRSTHLSG
jgi:predicted phage gp36 major capsid-like protein